MSLFAWIVLGLIAGFITSKIVGGTNRVAFTDIAFVIAGAIVGGLLFNTVEMAGVAGFNLFSLLVTGIGATLLWLVYHSVARRAQEVGGVRKFCFTHIWRNQS